jgi:hypothetical protein
LATTFPGFSQNCFEKRQIAACYFSKQICANLRSLATKRRETALFCLHQSFANSKGFGVKRLRTDYFIIILIIELQK